MKMRYLGLVESPYPHISKRKFAELPLSRSWKSILGQVEQLRGAKVRRFTADEHDTWIVFDYRAYEFGLHSVGNVVQFSVNDFDCPEGLLNDVLHQFSDFLSPEMGD
jgi:hypothetical protein